MGDVFTFGFNGNGRLGLAEPGSLDTKQRSTPSLLKSFENLAAKDTEDIGMPTDDSQAATTALVKALRPLRTLQRIRGLREMCRNRIDNIDKNIDELGVRDYFPSENPWKECNVW